MLYSHKLNKGGIYTLYEKILNESKNLTKEINLLQKKLKKLPNGKLICAKNGNHYKWYYSDTGQCHYLSKDQFELAEKLAQSTYYSTLLDDLSNEKLALDKYLKHHKANFKSEKLLKENPEFSRLLSSNFTPLQEKLTIWANEEFETNPSHQKNLIHKSSSGHMVRSKSEAIIDSLLFENNIPFRYECALTIGGITVYPDFTIRHPKTGCIYYWEHFGMMDMENYASSAFSKMQLYNSNGIFPSVQLIMTFEDSKHPLYIDDAKRIITNYFL